LARSADFDLAAALARPSFTPAVRDAPAIVALLATGDEPTISRAQAALAGLGEPGRLALESALAAGIADEGARAKTVQALGLHARHGDGVACAHLISALGDPGPRVRRAAIAAIGKLAPAPADARAAVLARWDAADVTPDERRTLAEALGKLGGADAVAKLRALDPGGDAELARRRDRGLLVAERGAKRGDDSEIRCDVAPPAPIAVALHCKPGLAPLLVDELRALRIGARAEGDHAVHVALAAPWATLFAARLWASAGIRVPRPPGDAGDALVASIVAGLTAPAPRALLAAWTRGPIRWRLELPEGKQRAVVWRVAREVTAAAPELVNDPTATAWDVRLADASALELVPRRAHDPRFAYRVADVPAASHPTVAAALARLAEPRDGDRVWDPFCGSGLELVECAQLARVTLAGTDLDGRALAAARANLAAAQLEAVLVEGDSRAATGDGDVDLAITNPPLGSRVQVDAAALLVAVLPAIARRLARGGRLVWITPAPQHTTRVAEQLGLRRTFHTGIDLGGVRGRLERWQR
jgi:protein-L-isoaspartate O-methyltransferase